MRGILLITKEEIKVKFFLKKNLEKGFYEESKIKIMNEEDKIIQLNWMDVLTLIDGKLTGIKWKKKSKGANNAFQLQQLWSFYQSLHMTRHFYNE